MRTSAVVLLLLAPLAASAQGQEEPGLRELVHGRGFGTGTAIGGTGLSADIISVNPAMMSAFRRYQLELSGAWDWGNRYAFGSATLVDSQSSRLAAGASYQLVSLGRAETRRTAHVNTLAFSYPVLDFLLLGVSGKQLLMSGAATANAITMDAGAALKIGPSFALAAAGHNLIDTGHAELTPYYTFSAGYVGGVFTLDFDLRADFNGPAAKLSYNAGGEYVFGQGLPVRAGYTYDAGTGSHYLSAGIGFFTEGGGLDLAYRTELNGRARMLVLTFRIQAPQGGG